MTTDTAAQILADALEGKTPAKHNLPALDAAAQDAARAFRAARAAAARAIADENDAWDAYVCASKSAYVARYGDRINGPVCHE